MAKVSVSLVSSEGSNVACSGDVSEGPGEAPLQLDGQQRSECEDHHQVHGGSPEAEKYFSEDTR